MQCDQICLTLLFKVSAGWKEKRHVTFYIIRYDMTQLISLLSLQDGWSALMFASFYGHTEIVKYLVDTKAALDLQEQVDYF